MPKSKSAGKPTLPRRLVEQLAEAEQYFVEEEYSEALNILLELEKAHPNEPEVLGMLLNIYVVMGEMRRYEHTVRRLAKRSPHNADIALGLAGAFIANQRMMLALRACEDFLRRWPDHTQADDVRSKMPMLQKMVDEQVNHTGLPAEQGIELARQHDELRYLMDHGQFELARLAAEKLLKRFPNFVPARNNLSQIHAALGNLDKAIDLARQVLEKDPRNLHARCNLARLLFLTGQPEEAHAQADQLKDAEMDASDRWNKLAETFSMLGDDAAVLDLYQRVKQAKELDPPFVDEYFYHLVGVAALRQGSEKQARRLWNKGLEINPNFVRTQQNLEELEKPIAERSGPWPFPMDEWLLGRAIRDLAILLTRQNKTKDSRDVQPIIRQFLEKYPEILFLAPHLLDRGDEAARDFVIQITALSGLPELVEPVKAFIFGRKGSSALRMRGAQMLAEAQLLPSGPVKMWFEDEQREVMLLSMEISPEPEQSNLSRTAQRLAEQAYDAFNQNDPERAQELLEKAIAIEPDDPTLHNNLAVAIGLQGDAKRANEMVVENHQRFPDYFFGITGMAQQAVDNEDFEQAHALLNRLLERKKLHTTEFVALATAQIDLALAERKENAALPWLEMLEQAAPEHPVLKRYQRLLKKKR